MKKSKPTPKQLLKKRVANNKEIRVQRDKCSANMDSDKVIEPLNVKHNYKKTYFKTHDRQLKEDAYRNPYAVPERLRVTSKGLPPRKEKPVPFIMDEPHTVCDIDPTFYTIIEGRPIRSFYDIKAYMRDIRDITLFRANTGYLKQEIILIEAGFTEEDEAYEKINDNFEKIKAAFVIFAEDSYKAAKRMQNSADEKAQQLAIVLDQLEGYSFEFVKLKNEFTDIVANYDNLSRYKKLLTAVSPHWWRSRYEEMCDVGTTLCTNLFTDLQSEAAESVALYKQSTVSLAQLEPQLYFKDPIELITILDDTSMQCLHYMEIDAYFSTNLKKVNAYRKLYKEVMIDQYEDMQDIIQFFISKVEVLEETRDYYQAAFDKILEKEFYQLVASYDSTMLFTCLQYVHAHIFGDKEDPRDTLTSLMLNIERLYYSLCTGLESLHQDVVKVATKQIFDEDNRVMKQAHDAQRDLKEYDVLCKSLYKSFEPSRRKTRN